MMLNGGEVTSSNVSFLLANFHQNFDLKNMISTHYRSDLIFYCKKNDPNSPDFKEK